MGPCHQPTTQQRVKQEMVMLRVQLFVQGSDADVMQFCRRQEQKNGGKTRHGARTPHQQVQLGTREVRDDANITCDDAIDVVCADSSKETTTLLMIRTFSYCIVMSILTLVGTGSW